MDRRDAFIIVAIALAAWAAASVGFRNGETAPIQQLVEDVPTLPRYEDHSDGYQAKVDRSTIVVVCDAHGPQIARWMASEGAALVAKGWRIQTIDLEGSTEFRCYIYQSGQWKIHNGHLSLSTLTSLLSRTTPPQPRSMQTGLPSVAEGTK